MEIRETALTDEVLATLIGFSKDWEAENSCHGYRANTREDIESNRIFLAEDDGTAIGYLFGRTQTSENMRSIMPEGTPYFEVEELYVVPAWRSRGVGGALFRFAESAVRNEAEFMVLSTATKNHRAILHFYLDEMGMDFWSARLFKRIGEAKVEPAKAPAAEAEPEPASEQSPIAVERYTIDRIPDVLAFERQLRAEEDDWGWEIDDAYVTSVTASFSDPRFANAVSFLAYVDGVVAGRIDAVLLPSHFDGSVKAYLDWICVIKSFRHRGVAQALLAALKEHLKGLGIDTLIALTASNDEARRFYQHIPDSKMGDIGIWIDVK